MGNIVDAVLVRGLLAFEYLFPMPSRLGVPLAPTGGIARRDPVVLIGGFANSISGWDEWRRSLEADGFQVFVFDPPTVGLGDMDESAEAVAAFIQDVKRRTGSAKVDVVGFSEGGLLTRKAVAQLGLLGSVDRLITLATPHAGVPARGLYDAVKGFKLIRLAIPEAAVQLIAGSEFITDLTRADGHLRTGNDPRAPRYASIFSRTIDGLVTPQSGWLAGAFNIPVSTDRPWRSGPNHFEMFHTSHRAYEAARTLLLDGAPLQAARAGLDSLRQG